MILFHSTTKERSRKIFEQKSIKNIIERYFTLEKHGDSYTTQGYVYLSNELFYSLSFANNHAINDQSASIVTFKIDIPKEQLLADTDEFRHHNISDDIYDKYDTEIDCTLNECKSCRIGSSISFADYPIYYAEFKIKTLNNNRYFSLNEELFDCYKLLVNCACSYSETIDKYTNEQLIFMNKIIWLNV